MAEHNFTLILSGDVDARADELFDAGWSDALLGEVDGVPYAEFDREAPSLAAAVMQALADAQDVDGVEVLRIEPDDLVTAAEIAERLGRSRESVRLLISGQRGRGGFPPPATHTRDRNRLWRWTEVLAWMGEIEASDAKIIAGLNAALELRARLRALEPADRETVERVALAA